MFSSVRQSFPRHSQRGIALLVTVILLAFLVLILVGTASLVRVETQVAENTQGLAQARQNALAGLNIAVGELQRHAGPDARITARADIVDPTDADLSQRYLTGVWHQDGGLRNWLVSGNETVATEAPGTPAVPPVNPQSSTTATAAVSPDPMDTFEVAGQPAALLVGEGSAGTSDSNMYVAAQKIGISGPKPDGSTGTVGRYAYWVGDDGIKADITLSDPSRLASSATTPNTGWGVYADTYGRDQIRARAFERVGLSALFPNADASNADWLSVVDRNQVTFVTAGTTPEVTVEQRQERFHDFAVGTAAVISDVTNNTLRTDVSTSVVTGGNYAAFDTYGSVRTLSDFNNRDSSTGDEGWFHPRARVYAGQGNFVGPVVTDLKLSMGVYVDPPEAIPAVKDVHWEYQIQVALANPYNAELWIHNDHATGVQDPVEPVRYRIKIWGLPVIRPAAGTNYQISGTDGAGNLQNEVQVNMNTAEVVGPGGWAADGDNAYASTPLTLETTATALKPGEILVFSLASGSNVVLSDLNGDSNNDAYYVNNLLVQGVSNEVIAIAGGGTVADAGISPPLPAPSTDPVRTFRLTRNFPQPPQPEQSRVFHYELYALKPNTATPSGPSDYDEIQIGGTYSVGLSTTPAFTPASHTWQNRSYINVGRTLTHTGWVGAGGADIRGPSPGINHPMGLDAAALTINLVGATNNAYWGDNSGNPSHVVLFDLPRTSLASVGEFRHAFRSGTVIWNLGEPGDSQNEIFDNYFCSTVPTSISLTDVQDGVPLPNPRMIIYKEPGVALDAAFLNELQNRNNSAYRLMMRAPFNLNSTSVRAWASILSSAAGHDLAVYDPVTESGNVSPGNNRRVIVRPRSAWPYYPFDDEPELERASLLSLFPKFNQAPGFGYFNLDEIAGVPNPDPAAASLGTQFMPYARSEWTMGARELRPFFEDERDIRAEMTTGLQMSIIEQVALSIVAQIRDRGEPFLSIEEFIDSGIIERAIGSTGIFNWSYQGGIGNPAIGGNATSNGLNYIYKRATGTWEEIDNASPAFLRQSDIIAALASFATVRSDTFTVRAYGESLNPTDMNKIEGRAWLEAVVQRVPTPVAPPGNPASGYTSNEYLNPPTVNLSGSPVELGRKFKIISLRWLSKDDI